jgi:hypothetical protein
MSRGTRDSESRNQRMRASYLSDVTSARNHRSRLHAYHVICGLLGGRDAGLFVELPIDRVVYDE